MIINMARVGRPGGKSSPSGWYRIVQRWFLMVFHFTRAKEGSQTIWNNKILNISRQNMPTFTRKSVKIHFKHWTVRAQPVMSSIFLRVHWLRPDCYCCCCLVVSGIIGIFCGILRSPLSVRSSVTVRRLRTHFHTGQINWIDTNQKSEPNPNCTYCTAVTKPSNFVRDLLTRKKKTSW